MGAPRITSILVSRVEAAHLKVRQSSDDGIAVDIGPNLVLYFDSQAEAAAFFAAGVEQIAALAPKPTFEVNPAEWRQLIAGTSLRGYLNPFSYAELVAAFGKPMTSTDGKVDAEWLIRWPDGVVATIYNYKDGPNYLGDEGTPVERITEWHVGGYPHGSADVVQRIADVLAEGAGR